MLSQSKTVSLIAGQEDILHDPNPKAMLIVEAIIQE